MSKFTDKLKFVDGDEICEVLLLMLNHLNTEVKEGRLRYAGSVERLQERVYHEN